MKFKSSLLSWVLNTIDLPIRFAYTQLGPISKLIHQLLFWRLYVADFKKLHYRFCQIKKLLKKHKINLKNKTVLEIGPGNSFIIAYNFLSLGAKKIILLDKFPRWLNSKKQKRFFRQELYYFKKNKKIKNVFGDKNNKINPLRLKLIANELTNANLTDIDFIFSNNVLEHINEEVLEKYIKKMKQILNKNGYMLHCIDLRDHFNFSLPFLFYKYNDSIWYKYLTKNGISYTNRLRYDDFIKIFKKYKFKIVWQNIAKLSLPKNLKLDKKFKNKGADNLEVTSLKILLKK